MSGDGLLKGEDEEGKGGHAEAWHVRVCSAFGPAASRAEAGDATAAAGAMAASAEGAKPVCAVNGMSRGGTGAPGLGLT